MRQTSLLAYKEVKPKRHTAHEKIINLMEITIRPPSNSEIAKSLGWSINRVTPRVNELVKLGKLSENQERFIELMKARHYFTAVCRSLDEFMTNVNGYMAL